MDWDKLLVWYRKNGRLLPWRKFGPSDPYPIWISEIMSQQSTLKTVVPRFEHWMAKFPTIQSLSANKDEALLLKYWEGLGYYSRARNIFRTAQLIKANNFDFPRSIKEWESLPGVGPYTARAIVSISFGVRESVPLDGNVLRVGARLWGIPDPQNSSGDRVKIGKKFDGVLKLLSQTTFVGDAVQALIELGALGCRPGEKVREFCPKCPLNKNCLAFKKSDPVLWPLPKKREPVEAHPSRAFVLTLKNSKKKWLLLRKIPQNEPLGEQLEIPWELNSGHGAFSGGPLPSFFKKKGFRALHPKVISHSIMNRKFLVRVWGGEISKEIHKNPSREWVWVDFSDLEGPEILLSTLTRKILRLINPPKSVQITENYGTPL